MTRVVGAPLPRTATRLLAHQQWQRIRQSLQEEYLAIETDEVVEVTGCLEENLVEWKSSYGVIWRWFDMMVHDSTVMKLIWSIQKHYIMIFHRDILGILRNQQEWWCKGNFNTNCVCPIAIYQYRTIVEYIRCIYIKCVLHYILVSSIVVIQRSMGNDIMINGDRVTES